MKWHSIEIKMLFSQVQYKSKQARLKWFICHPPHGVHCRMCLGTCLRTSWDVSQDITGRVLGHRGMCLGTSWDMSWDIMGHILEHHGTHLGTSWDTPWD